MLPTCNVLLVEDSQDFAMLVNRYLAASRLAAFRVSNASTLRGARDALGRDRFDAVLLDLNLPDSRGMETFAGVREAARGAAIVILTAEEDEAVATAAIGLGAADFLIKGEVGGEGLARRIRFAIERGRAAAAAPEPAPPGKAIVLAGSRGGAGVSTTAINLAAILSRRGRNVILLELRSHGGVLGAMLGVAPPLTIETLAELGGPNSLESTRIRLPFGAHLLAAPSTLDSGGTWEPAGVSALVDKAASLADVVLIDATIALPHLLKPAVARAAFTLLVLEREPVSIQLASRLIGPFTAWSGKANAIGAVLVNHIPFIDSAPLPAIRAELNCGVVGVLPPARDVLQSYRRQGPIAIAQPQSPVAVALDDLATRLDHDPIQFMSF
jgi:MinD-like ATPase involved in chromosome partitioning or flagellar assembly/CheY-like chemotaxis protein